jgi:hypothetical protein
MAINGSHILYAELESERETYYYWQDLFFNHESQIEFTIKSIVKTVMTYM